jgi:hypothetical protein
MKAMRIELHPVWSGGKAGYLYSVTIDGEVVLDRVRDPECDLARVLVSRCITGKVLVHDGETGMPRTIIDVEKLARLSARDGDRLRFATWKPHESGAVAGYSPEDESLVLTMPPEANEAA